MKDVFKRWFYTAYYSKTVQIIVKLLQMLFATLLYFVVVLPVLTVALVAVELTVFISFLRTKVQEIGLIYKS